MPIWVSKGSRKHLDCSGICRQRSIVLYLKDSMPGFDELRFRAFYRTGENDLVSDFYTPALAAATYYDRSSGYFTASALAILAKGLQEFLSHQGNIRMVIS